MFGDKSEVSAACSIAGIIDDDDIRSVMNLFEEVKRCCDDIVASSQRISIIYGCVWTFIKLVGQHGDYPTSIEELISRLSADRNIDDSVKLKRGTLPVSAVTVGRKYYEITKFVLSRVMKRVYAICLGLLDAPQQMVSNTPDIPVTLTDCTDPDKIAMRANDGFVYPLDDVDDVADWNIIFGMKFPIELPIRIVVRTKTVEVVFSNCKTPVSLVGPSILNSCITAFMK